MFFESMYRSGTIHREANMSLQSYTPKWPCLRGDTFSKPSFSFFFGLYVRFQLCNPPNGCTLLSVRTFSSEAETMHGQLCIEGPEVRQKLQNNDWMLFFLQKYWHIYPMKNAGTIFLLKWSHFRWHVNFRRVFQTYRTHSHGLFTYEFTITMNHSCR